MNRQYVFKRQYKRALVNIFDALGYAFKSTQQSPLPIPKRLLIIRWDQLGDVLCALPLIRSLAQLEPKPYIAVSVSPSAAPLLRDIVEIDEIIPFQASWFSRAGARRDSVHQLIKNLKTKKFDTVLDLRGDLRHHLIMAWAGISHRAGYGITGGGFLLEHVLPWSKDEHAVERNLQFLSLWPSVNRNNIPSLPWKPRPEELSWLTGAVGKDPYVVLHPDAGTSAKQWPIDRYANFAKALKRSGIQAVVVGTDQKMRQSAQAWGTPVIDLIGKTTLPQLVTLLQQSQGLISTDSGPAHIAAAFAKPVWVLWSGTSNPQNWKPLGPHVYFAQHHVACEYCEQSVCPVSGHPCLNDLTWETVARAFQPSFEQHLKLSLTPAHV